MSLRGPAAPRRKTWTRPGDDSYWDGLTPDPPAPRPALGQRPRSAVEGGQLDGWLKHLQRIQQTPNPDEVGPFGDAKEAGWRAKWTVPSSWGSSSGGTSSLSSQESLQTSVPSPPERRDTGRETARISQAAKKEQTRVSFLTPVKIGWLPIRRKVTMVGEQGRSSDATRQQVKLKPPITPTIVKNAPSSANSCSDEEVQRSPAKAGARTPWSNQDSPVDKQVPEKRSFPAAPVSVVPVSWQALKRGWKLNRVLALPGTSPSDQTQTRTNLDHSAPHNFTQSHNVQQDKPELTHRTTFSDQSRESVSYKAPSSVQPLKASHIQTTSETKTLIPENKAGFSSITISSRKVCRSSSLPLPPSSTSQESMDPNSRQIMVQRKATIVKVTEQRVTTGPIRNVNVGQNQPSSQKNIDTVVHRRKATIIKVTELRESFTPTNARRNNEYRHSYTEGLHNENRISSQQNHVTPVDSKPIHRSTLNLVMTPPPAILAPPAKPELRNITSNRQQRPSSCYGNVFGNTEEIGEKKSQPLSRKLSLDSTQNGVGNQKRGWNVIKANGQSNNSEEKMTLPALTLIQTPDADQTAEDVLALNAAAIIANIKLQRQMSKKKTPNGKSENHSTAAGPTETAVQESVKDDDGSTKSHAAAFVPLSNDIQRSTQNMSLQEALQRSRPDFISRSRRRTRELERKTQERRAKTRSTQAQINKCPGTSVKGNIYKPSNRVVTRKLQSTFRRPAEVKSRQEEEEETRRDASLNNRQRADVFKKKRLDQVLHRSKD